jgi:hypothetical protein
MFEACEVRKPVLRSGPRKHLYELAALWLEPLVQSPGSSRRCWLLPVQKVLYSVPYIHLPSAKGSRDIISAQGLRKVRLLTSLRRASNRVVALTTFWRSRREPEIALVCSWCAINSFTCFCSPACCPAIIVCTIQAELKRVRTGFQH